MDPHTTRCAQIVLPVGSLPTSAISHSSFEIFMETEVLRHGNILVYHAIILEYIYHSRCILDKYIATDVVNVSSYSYHPSRHLIVQDTRYRKSI